MDYNLVGISACYAVTVFFVVTVLENKKEFSGIFTKGGRKWAGIYK